MSEIPMWVDPKMIAKAQEDSAEIRRKMAPIGALGLPELLDARRLEYGITDGAFDIQCAFDRVLIYQIPEKMFAKNTFGDTMIQMPEAAKDRRRNEAPRGVLISAGLKALDNLRSNGMDLGHIVTFLRLAPWRIACDMIGGVTQYVFILRDGDIIGSEDTARDLRDRRIIRKSVKVKDEAGVQVVEHVYQSRDGTALSRMDPWISEDY